MWIDLINQDEIKLIPVGESIVSGAITTISDNGISIVYRCEDWIYKRSIPFLIENELWCFEKMFEYDFVPYAKRWDKYTLQIQYLEPMLVTNKKEFKLQCYALLDALRACEIRHGDLTKYAVIVRDNKPYLIDFAESRLMDDPRPDKRPKGDGYWIWRTFKELCSES